ncbi:MAG: F0F1 ATP synthase subunit delta [Candidatus Protistobacter heckmanni]|nr:F0F1 ATP synthase subunit delta [Candidatus Protistobacter heckmanni]
MAELATIARPYAEALYRVAKAGSVAAWSDLIDEMAQVAAHPDLRAVAGDPHLGHAKLVEVVAGSLKTKLSVEAQNFLQMLVDNGRLTALPEIAAQFHALANADAGAAEAFITSAFPIEGAQLSELVAALERKFGKKLKPEVAIDAELIGGVRVQVGDEVLDASVRARLTGIRNALTAA